MSAIQVTEKALKEIKRIQSSDPETNEGVLRVQVVGGGCSHSPSPTASSRSISATRRWTKASRDRKSTRTINHHFTADQIRQAHDSKPHGFPTPVLLRDGESTRASALHDDGGVRRTGDDAIGKPRASKLQDITRFDLLRGIHHPPPNTGISSRAPGSGGFECLVRERPALAITDFPARLGDTVSRDAWRRISRLGAERGRCRCDFGLRGTGNDKSEQNRDKKSHGAELA